MRIRLTKITRSRAGQEIRAERMVDADAPVIGRGSHATIHLADPRVALEHATIFADEGTLRIVGMGTAVLLVDGRLASDIPLLPGAHFEVGPFLFTVEAPAAGADLALAYEQKRDLPDELSQLLAKSKLTLAAAGLRKRGMAWGLFLWIAFLFLIVPVLNAVTPPLRALTAAKGVTPEIAWNPGPLSSGHAGWTHDCAKCHETPFLRVRDHECLACHKGMPGHVTDASLQETLFGSTRCAECHRDHRGRAAPIRADATLCASCHANLHRVDAQTTLDNATDFLTDHPGFKPALWRGPGLFDVLRVKQTDKAEYVETSNLKFNHEKHLKPGVKSPKGPVDLDCSNCHVPDESGKLFVAVRMTAQCLDCHKLNFEPANDARQVPHGSVEDAWALIREFYANLSLSDVATDTVQGGAIDRGVPMPSEAIVTDEQRARALGFARNKAAQVGRDLFEKRVCVVCHDVQITSPVVLDGSDAPWQITPVHVVSRWLPLAGFDHSKHATRPCKECHDVEHSRKSADIAMPTIDVCRKCHAGNTPVAGKIVSTCVTCHGYHASQEFMAAHNPIPRATVRGQS